MYIEHLRIIDGTHIPLADLPNKRVTFAIGDFFNRTKFHNIVLKAMCDETKSFGTFMLANLEGYIMVGNSKGIAYMYK
jgi:hypothetical protein